ncbi:GD25455 [Drosophila simulans]|uniref:GD25455 n=1 Tax=Drosophila simulans TaxID=7240 RepID=B4QBB2_DROSI|nr:GD25455 [Drosophila simulans]
MSRSTSKTTSLLCGSIIIFFVTICGCLAQGDSSYLTGKCRQFWPFSGTFIGCTERKIYIMQNIIKS